MRCPTAGEDSLLARARAGDEQAFRELIDPHRRELQLHCYRILGSLQDAEDTLQETLLAAWRGLGHFEGRAPLRAWLYQIATNRCLNALRNGGRRPRHVPPDPPFKPPQPTRWIEPPLFEPYPDALLDELIDTSASPEARYEIIESIELAFIAALHYLTPRQRAVIVLRDVLGFRTEAVARVLGTTQGSVKGALQRARLTLDSCLLSGEHERAPLHGSEHERSLAARFADAFERGDVEGLVSLLTDDAWLTMPPYPHAYQGPRTIGDFLRASATWRGARGYTLVPTRANTQPAFGCYLHDPDGPFASAAGLVVLTLEGGRLAHITRFMDIGPFPYFGLPPTLEITALRC